MSRARHQYEMQPVTNELDYALNCAAIEIDTTNARAELAQLRAAAAELQAAQERIAELSATIERKNATIEAQMQAIDSLRRTNAEQARQLEEAREMIDDAMACNEGVLDHKKARAWLAANAPQTHEQSA